MPDELSKPALNKLSVILQQRKRTIENILSRSINSHRFIHLISSAIHETPKLLECTPLSVLNCVVQAAQMGLEIRKESAYLVPFKNSKANRIDCNLLIDFRGKINIAYRSGLVHDIETELVYECDEFEYEKGHNPKFRHVPRIVNYGDDKLLRIESEDMGEVVAAYCIATFSSGGKHVEMLNYARLEGIRKRAKGGDRTDSPWNTDRPQMQRKSAVHAAYKYLPTNEAMALSQEIDSKFETEASLDVLPGLEPTTEGDDEPMVRVVTAEEQKALGAARAEAVKPTASAKKMMEIKKYPPKDGYPVMSTLPPTQQVGDMQKIWLRKDGDPDKLFQYEAAADDWFEVPTE